MLVNVRINYPYISGKRYLISFNFRTVMPLKEEYKYRRSIGPFRGTDDSSVGEHAFYSVWNGSLTGLMYWFTAEYLPFYERITSPETTASQKLIIGTLGLAFSATGVWAAYCSFAEARQAIKKL